MDIESQLKLYMEGKGLHEEKLMLFGRPQFSIPKFFLELFFKHDIHHMITGFGADLVGELKLLCWEVGAGTPWYYAEKYIKFPLVFLFKPFTAMAAFKLGQTQYSLYDVDDGTLRSKTLQENEYCPAKQINNQRQAYLNRRKIIVIKITDTLVLNNQQEVTCAGFLDHYVAGVTTRALLYS